MHGFLLLRLQIAVFLEVELKFGDKSRVPRTSVLLTATNRSFRRRLESALRSSAASPILTSSRASSLLTEEDKHPCVSGRNISTKGNVIMEAKPIAVIRMSAMEL